MYVMEYIFGSFFVGNRIFIFFFWEVLGIILWVRIVVYWGKIKISFKCFFFEI